MNNIELLCGDCLELMKNIPDKSIDLIVTDPPLWNRFNPTKREWEIQEYKNYQ